MRVKPVQLIALVSATLFPLAGEASLISSDSVLPGITSASPAGGTTSTGGGSSSSLLDVAGNPLLLLSGSESFEHADDQNKLRDPGGDLFAPDQSCCGGGSGGGTGGSGGGSLPGLGNFNLLSFEGLTDPTSLLEQGLNLDLEINLDLNLPLDQCCDCNECGGSNGQTVPEPSAFFLAASGLALGLRRVVTTRGGTVVRS